MIDDGTAENAVGFGDSTQNFEAVWFNQFDVIPGQTTITSIEIAWGNRAGQNMDGLPIKVGIRSDPNGDKDPSDAVLLVSFAGKVQQSDTNTFVTYKLSPRVILPEGATSFFVGDMTPMNHPEVFLQPLDEDSSLHRRSWAFGMTDGSPVNLVYPAANDFGGIIDDFGLPGNWLIRADTTQSAFFLQSAASVKQMFAVDSGTVEDRSGGPSGTYTVVMTFNQEVTSVGPATTSCGNVARTAIDNTDPHKVIVSLTAVGDDCDGSEITVIAPRVMDAAGDSIQKARLTFGLLLGDVNGDRVVDDAEPGCNPGS